MAKFLEYVGNRDKGVLLVKKASNKSPHRRVEYRKNQVWKLGKDLPENIGNFIVVQCPSLFKIRVEEDDPKELFEDIIKKAVYIQKEYDFDPVDILKKYFRVSKSKAPGRKPKDK